MNVSWVASVSLCNICLSSRGLVGTVNPQQQIGAVVAPLPTASAMQVTALGNFVTSNPPTCPHIFINPSQLAPSDQWAQLNACLAAIPAPPQSGPDPYALIRTRYQGLVAIALTDANNMGGLA